MFPDIFRIASANAGVKSQLGSSPVRLYPAGRAPQGVVYPYAVWQTISGAPQNYLAQVPTVDLFSVQVDVYATTVTDARNAAKALRDAIEPCAHIVGWRGEMTDPDTGSIRVSFSADFWTDR